MHGDRGQATSPGIESKAIGVTSAIVAIHAARGRVTRDLGLLSLVLPAVLGLLCLTGCELVTGEENLHLASDGSTGNNHEPHEASIDSTADRESDDAGPDQIVGDDAGEDGAEGGADDAPGDDADGGQQAVCDGGCVNQTCVQVDGGTSCLGDCAPGQTHPAPCGNCGTDTQTCGASGTWVPSGVCSSQGACAPSATQACNTNGTQTCTTSCGWGACSCPLAPVCTPGTAQCSGNGVETCDACGQWGAAVACAAGESCVPSGSQASCGGQCSPSQTRSVPCGNCGTDMQTCGPSGTWVGSGTCSGQGACAASATQACNTYGTETCSSTCAWGTCSCGANPVCTPGAMQCSNNAVQTCNSCGQWGTGTACGGQACVQSGAMASCAGNCSPGQTRGVACGNCGTDTQTCGSSGTWVSSGTCSGQGACAPSATQSCNSYGTESCSTSCAWGTCSCGASPVCTPGAMQCSSNGVQTCNSCGQWGTATACSASLTCVVSGTSASCTGVCGPGQTHPVACGNCGTDTQTCGSSGSWVSSGTCSGQGACAPSATQSCNMYGTETCSSSCAWGTCSCGPNPTCTPGAQKCSGNGIQTCNSCGQWGSAVACSASLTCVNNGSSASCTGVCGPGQTHPVACGYCGTDTETCSTSGAWQSSGTCAGQGPCSPTSTQMCNTYGLQTCSSSCAWGACSCAASTPACTPSAKQCSSTTQIETCNSCGQWGTPSTCTYACVSGNCGGSCVPGTYRCDPDATVNAVDICSSAGAWGVSATCSSPSQICQLNGSGVGSCQPNNPYYIGDSTADSSWSNFQPSTDTSFLVSTVASLTGGATSAYVLALGAYARVAGGWCDLYLYSDNGGAPGTLLTSILQVTIGAGLSTGTPQPNAQVTAGQTYWVGGVCDSSPALYQKNIASQTVYVTPQTFGNPMPSTYPIAQASPNSGLGVTFAVKVQNVP